MIILKVKYYKIHPEVPGGIGERTVFDKSIVPWELKHLHVKFEGWSGGEIMKVSNCYLVTSRMREVIEKAQLSGIDGFDEIDIELTDTFRDLYPNRVLPCIYRLLISGKLGLDDFGMINYYELAVSERALEVIRKLDISDMEISLFDDKTDN